MIKLKHIINIFLALTHEIENAKKEGREADEEELENTLEWLIDKDVNFSIPLGCFPLQGQK